MTRVTPWLPSAIRGTAPCRPAPRRLAAGMAVSFGGAAVVGVSAIGVSPAGPGGRTVKGCALTSAWE